MDKYHIQNGITFVWDQKKVATNIVKHDGISFEQATQAFFDPSCELWMRVKMTKQEKPLLAWINTGIYYLSCIF